jgi:plastocyanin
MNVKALSLFLLLISPFFLQEVSAANHLVIMNNTAFVPTTLTIGVGDRVTWTNTSVGLGSTHTSTRGDPVCSTNGFGSTFWNSGSMASRAVYSFTFTNFPAGNYTYLCVQHCVNFGMKGTIVITNSGVTLPPTVSITNPPAGKAFVAPASVTIEAAVAGGSITNVQFLIGPTVLADDNAAPYAAITNGLPAGNYNLVAVASDNSGMKATNSISIFVLTNAMLSNPVRLADGQFQLTINGIAGQTYATETSTNLVNWTAFATNVAPADIFSVTDALSTNVLQQFYRARQNF